MSETRRRVGRGAGPVYESLVLSLPSLPGGCGLNHGLAWAEMLGSYLLCQVSQPVNIEMGGCDKCYI